MRIAFPEHNHPTIQSAITTYNTQATQFGLSQLTAIPASNLVTACELVKSGEADTIIAGIEYSSRDVILAYRTAFSMGNFADGLKGSDDLLGVPVSREPYSTFSGLAVMHKTNKTYLLADMAACKHPTKEQLTEIIEQTYSSAQAILSEHPRIALLSFSTHGSGGHDDSIDLLRSTLSEFQGTNLLIDGEMQLDAAINPKVARQKFPESPVAGRANVLIAPDLNSGNLLYKAFEQIGGFTVAGPILQGFSIPVSDLSRGSTIEDVVFTIEIIAKLLNSAI